MYLNTEKSVNGGKAMKNRLTVIVSVAMSVLLIVSVFTACSFNKESSTESTTLAPDESWNSGENESYQPVEIEGVELAAIVSEALGEEAEGFDGDLSSLSEDQLKKVVALAEKEGYAVETNADGKTVIKKDSSIESSDISDEKASDIMSDAGVKSSTRLSREQYERVSRAAKDRGASAVTDKNGDVRIIETSSAAATTTTTRASSGRSGRNNNTTNPEPDNPPAGTTSSGSRSTTSSASGTTTARTTTTRSNPVTPPTSIKSPVGGETVKPSFTEAVTAESYKVSDVQPDATNTFKDKGSFTTFNSCAATDDGGVVCVGTQMPEGDSNPLIVKFNKNGKEKWNDTYSADSLSDFADVAVLKNGSIVAVGTTTASDIAPQSEYKAINTAEGIIARYSDKGKREMFRIFGGSGGDLLYAVAATSDGGYVVAGETDSPDADLKNVPGEYCKAFVAKFDSSDNIQWIQAVSCPRKSYCRVNDICVSGDDIYAVIQTNAKAGDFETMDGAKNGRVFSVVEKLDSSGKQQWMKDFYENGSVELVSITPANDGGCVVGGYYSILSGGLKGSFNGPHEYYAGGKEGVILRVDGSGRFRWFQNIKGSGNDFIKGVTAIPEGYAFIAQTNSTTRDFVFPSKGDYDCYFGIIETSGGKPVKMRSFGGEGTDTAGSICYVGDGTVFACGNTNSKGGDFADVDAKSDGSAHVAFIRKYELTSEKA